MKQIKIIQKKTSDLKQYSKNARIHNLTQIEQIAESIKEFGFNNPILIDENGEVIAGHGRMQAGILLDLETLPCIIINDLNDVQKKSYRLADNKIALNSAWDTALLESELKEIMSDDHDFDLCLTGFTEDEIEYMTIKEIDFNNIEKELNDEEEKTPRLCPHCNGEL